MCVIIVYLRLEIVLSISSEAVITLEFISYARCAVIILTISVTGLTLAVSKKPCKIDPTPPTPGIPTVAAPDAGVSKSKLSPIASKPASFGNVTNSSWPTFWGAIWPSILARTSPEALIDTDTASAGTAIPGETVNPSWLTINPSGLN